MAIIFLTCSKYKNNNPIDPDYQGDYRLTVLHSGLPDTLRVFHSYAVACSTGADTFSTYRIAGAATGAISLDAIRFGRPDSIIFHCFGTFNGMVEIEGVRPNGKTMSDSMNVHIVNPYSIIGDSVAVVNETSPYRIARPLADTPVAGMSVIWTSGGARDSMGLDSAFSFKPVNGQPLFTVNAVIEDESGHSLALAPVFVRVITSFRPVLSVASMSNEATLGKPLTITITNTDRSIPTQVMGGVLNIAVGYYHSLIFKNDSTVCVCGINDEGQLGDGTTINRNQPVKISF